MIVVLVPKPAISKQASFAFIEFWKQTIWQDFHSQGTLGAKQNLCSNISQEIV